jgi:hypothetical protein
MMQLHVRREYLLQESHELVKERHEVADELSHCATMDTKSEMLKRQLAAITVNLQRIQSELAATTETITKEGLSK